MTDNEMHMVKNKPNLSDEERWGVLEYLLQQRVGLEKKWQQGALRDVATKCGVHRMTIWRIWNRGVIALGEGGRMDVSSRMMYSGRK